MPKQKLWIDLLGYNLIGVQVTRLGKDNWALVRKTGDQYKVLWSGISSEANATQSFRDWRWEVLCHRRLEQQYVDACEAAENERVGLCPRRR